MTILLKIWDGHSGESQEKIIEHANELGLKCIGACDYDIKLGYRLVFTPSEYATLADWDTYRSVDSLVYESDANEELCYDEEEGYFLADVAEFKGRKDA